MSLRLRLLLMIGISLGLLWGGVAVWMLRDLGNEMRVTLDQRLAMSARMVAGLISQNPAVWDQRTGTNSVSTLSMPAAAKGLACQVSSLRGEVFARTPGATSAAIATTAPGFAEREIEGERWRSYTFEAHGLRITTADRMAERNSLLRDVMAAAIVPFVVALIGSLMMLWIGVKSGLVPLERLRQALASRAPDALTPISDIPVPRELLPLVNTLNQLLQRMRVTISRERRFTSDAAHELRTPLTALKTHLQVARITRGKEAEIALDYAEEGAARLQHTLLQLLTLAQVEGPFSWDDGHTTHADAVARLAMRDAAPDTPERIVLDSDGKSAELALPQALAVTALRNLLDNALRYSPAERGVKLEIQSAQDSVCFRVCDCGPGLSAEELTLVTQRFWRRGSGRGSGLGLSIVAAIAERFGGALELVPRPAGGLEAELTLPRAPHDYLH
ncbi:MAG: two-component sensor histidine kinase [Glaciimonas sp.]|nr:two-component sensor histidine kinase [Glaciimonas sp.]